MNKYAALGLASEAATEGKQIAVIVHAREIDYVLQEIGRALPEQVLKVYMANGAQRVTFASGGRIDVIAVSSHRTITQRTYADIIFVDGRPDESLSPTEAEEFRESLRYQATIGHSQVVRS